MERSDGDGAREEVGCGATGSLCAKLRSIERPKMSCREPKHGADLNPQALRKPPREKMYRFGKYALEQVLAL